MPIIGSPVTATDLEGLTLDSLVLNDGTFGLTNLDLTPPKQRADWVGSADSEYSALFRDPLYENRTITAKLSIAPQADMDAALAHIADVRDKLAEASKLQDGLELEWVPANGTTSVTFDVLAGEITDLPIDWENGWLAQAPSVTVVMTAKPYWRRTVETVLSAVSSGTSPVTTVEIPDVGGDAPALGRLIISNTGTGAIRWLEWGLEQRGYNAASPDALVIDSDSLVTSGFAGAQATRSGAYDVGGGNNVVRVTVPSSTTAMCGTGTLAHVGRFKVSARVYADDITTRIRLTWRAGDGGYTANPWTTAPVADVFASVDLGIVDIPAAVIGTQAWDGRIEVYDPSGAANTIDADLLKLTPTSEGYGRSKAMTSSASGSVTAFDSFAGTTATSALGTRTPTIGAAWATSGGATDFAFADPTTSIREPWISREHLVRSASGTTRRFAVFGASVTDQQVDGQLETAGLASGGDTFPFGDFGMVARWTDSSNYLRWVLDGAADKYRLVKVVAGVETELAKSSTQTAVTANALILGGFIFSLTARASGVVTASIVGAPTSNQPGIVMFSAQVIDTDIATGGPLASGKGGIVDSGNGTFTGNRRYIDVQVSIPPAESVVAYSSRGYEVRSDDTYRESTGGGTWGRETSYRGARFLIPPAGTADRTSRVVVHATTADLESAAMDTVTASYDVEVAYTERGLVVPR